MIYCYIICHDTKRTIYLITLVTNVASMLSMYSYCDARTVSSMHKYILTFPSDSIFAFSSWSFTDILIVLKRLWTAQLPQEVPAVRWGRNQGTSCYQIMQYRTKMCYVDYRNILFFPAAEHPSWDLGFSGEILGQGLAKSQRLGEDLLHQHKSKFPI